MKQLNWYQIFGNTHIIPDGRTVTPTDDIQTLLHCANIWDKDYTTLAEVLADDDTLFLICISNNAIDYLVRSTTWAAINGLVPIMTSNTTPSGVVSSNSVRPSSNYPWNAFNGIDNGGGWCPTNAGNNLYIQYKFESATLINSITVKSMNAAQQSAVWSLKASNDGVTFVELTTVNEPDPNNKVTKSFGNTTEYQYYRLEGYFTNSGGGVKVQFYSPSIVMSESAMQYIGASDYASETLLSDSTWNSAVHGSPYASYVENVSVPAMTGYKTPSGEAFASSEYGTNYAWRAFDSAGTSTDWVANSANQYCAYDFERPVKIYKYNLFGTWSGSQMRLKDYDVIAATDRNGTWDVLKSETYPNSNSAVSGELTSNNQRCYGVKIKTSYDSTYYGIGILQFYGRENAGVQSWLKAGGITNKKYTTVSEVLSDLTTLAALMSSSDAIDYLVTAKGWATEICSDSNAMADIGMNNYAANTLLADETWGTAICESTYFTSVLNVASPDMTSSTTPYGEATGSTPVGSNPAWQAFNSNPSLQWVVSNYGSPYIQYKFTSEVRIFCYALMGSPKSGSSPTNRLKDYRIYASNTSVDMSSHLLKTAVWDSSISSDSAARRFYLPTEESYQYYLLVADSMYSGSDYRGVAVLKFYGRKDI